MKTPDGSIETVLREYSDVLQGISCFREKNTGKKIEVKLEMETDTKPVAQKPRPVPYHLQKPIKDCLDQRVKEEIFEKASDGEVIAWCSPLVEVQPKPKFTKKKSEEHRNENSKPVHEAKTSSTVYTTARSLQSWISDKVTTS